MFLFVLLVFVCLPLCRRDVAPELWLWFGCPRWVGGGGGWDGRMGMGIASTTILDIGLPIPFPTLSIRSSKANDVPRLFKSRPTERLPSELLCFRKKKHSPSHVRACLGNLTVVTSIPCIQYCTVEPTLLPVCLLLLRPVLLRTFSREVPKKITSVRQKAIINCALRFFRTAT